MRLHVSYKITVDTLYDAVKFATAQGEGWVSFDYSEHGSRSNDHAFDVTLTGDGTTNRRRVNYGTARHIPTADKPYAATWNQWGWFFAHLFAIDPSMSCYAYSDAADFHDKTAGKFTGFDGYTYTAQGA